MKKRFTPYKSQAEENDSGGGGGWVGGILCGKIFPNRFGKAIRRDSYPADQLHCLVTLGRTE